MKNSFSIKKLLIIGFLFGLLCKILMLFYNGMYDIDDYYVKWANISLKYGLLETFIKHISPFAGSYFPVQIHILTFCAWVQNLFNLNFHLVIKLLNLLFDIGNFFLFLCILNKLKLNQLYALLYWLHPWFLAVFSLGYMEFHFSFFVLLSVLLFLKADTLKDYFWTGLPLAMAFFMKPQAQIIMATALLYAVFHYLKTKRFDIFGLFIFPAILFVIYSLYFIIALYYRYNTIDIFFLARTYLNTSNIMPCLNGTMLNFWYAVAYILKGSNPSIVSVSDQIQILPNIQIKHLAMLTVLGLVSVYTYLVNKIKLGKVVNENWIYVFTFSALIVPFVMTSAHENHPFLASLFLVIFLAKPVNKILKFAIHIILILIAINLYILYSTSNLAMPFQYNYEWRIMFLFSIIATVCFLIITFFLFKFVIRSATIRKLY